MYSPAALPSSTRAAPAKKRMLSARDRHLVARVGERLADVLRLELGQLLGVRPRSRRRASSSASARSPGVVSSHSGSAAFAASTARSTSACVPLGTSAIVSPVAGFSTSIVPPSTASTHLPPTKFLCCETVTLIESLPVETAISLRLAAAEARLLRQALRDHDRDDRQHDHHEHDRVHDRAAAARAGCCRG